MYPIFTLKVEASLDHTGRGTQAYTIDALRDDMPGPTTLGSLRSIESVSALLGMITEFLADGFTREDSDQGPRYAPKPDTWEPKATNVAQKGLLVEMMNKFGTVLFFARFPSPQEALDAKRIVANLLQHALGFRRDATVVMPTPGTPSLSRTDPPRPTLAQAAAAAGTSDAPDVDIDFGDVNETDEHR